MKWTERERERDGDGEEDDDGEEMKDEYINLCHYKAKTLCMC